MNKLRISTERKHLKVPNSNHRAEEYSNWTKKYNRFNNRLDQKEERIYELEDRAVPFIQS